MPSLSSTCRTLVFELSKTILQSYGNFAQGSYIESVWQIRTLLY